jgi:mono/diheme cytochrome c family protein/rhodanese-related sulfurtransferase
MVADALLLPLHRVALVVLMVAFSCAPRAAVEPAGPSAVGPSGASATPSKPAPASTPAPASREPVPAPEDGAALYARYCALCHGADREGYAADDAPSLRSPELMGAAPGGYLWTAIAYGRPGTPMAAFAEGQGGPLDHDAQHRLMDWLIETAEVERKPVEDGAVSGDPDRGQAVYAAHCAECHGASGEGGTGTALANPVFLATASDTFMRDTVRRGRTGTPMPAFAERLPAADIDAVVSFLRSRSTGWDAPPPVRVRPPDPSKAVLNPQAPVATLEHREDRFVSAASVASAIERGERLVLLDARPLSDWQRSHLPGALPMPFYDGVDAIIPHLPDDGTPIVAYCACPHAASGKVVDALTERGFTAARILDEGVLHWAAQGYPLELGETP